MSIEYGHYQFLPLTKKRNQSDKKNARHGKKTAASQKLQADQAGLQHRLKILQKKEKQNIQNRVYTPKISAKKTTFCRL
jgi:hypothetical protein